MIAAGPAMPPVPRLPWLDAARGIGILLVVTGHALGGLIDSPLGAGAAWLRPMLLAIYTFHMPLFFLLAGVLVDGRLARDPGGFRAGLWRSIAWPYFLWSAVQITLIYSLGRIVNTPVANYGASLATLPWQPVAQFWFLHALFQFHLLSLLLWRRLGPAAFLLLMLALKPLATLIDLPDALRLAAGQAPFYGIGVVIGTAGLARAFVDRPAAFRLLLLPLAAAMVALALDRAPGLRPDLDIATARASALATLAWSLPLLPAALAGLAAVVALASLLRGRLATVLAFLGKRSMAIYILHIMAVAGTRIVSQRLGLHDPALLLALTVTAGVIGPLVAHAVLSRARLAGRLGLG